MKTKSWILKILFLVSKLFGFAPFLIIENGQVIPSKRALIYSIIIYFAAVFSQGNILVGTLWTTDLLSVIGVIILELCGIVTYISNVFIILKRNKELVLIIDQLITFHDYLDKPQYTNKLLRQIILLICLGFVDVGLLVVFFNFCVQKTFYENITSYIKLFGNYIMILQFASLVSICRCHLMEINSRLEHLDDLYSRDVANTHTLFMANSNSYFLHSKTRLTKKGNIDLKSLVLHCVFDHHKICDVLQSINEMYSVQILLSTMKFFISITYTLHFIKSIIIYLTIRKHIYVLLTALILCIRSVYQLLLIILPCHSTIVEGRRTGVLVHKLLWKTRDPAVREELHLFSLQLLHREVRLTACGFFPLDFTLLYSIIGAVTTYFVILMQFQLSINEPHRNETTTSVHAP